MFEGTYTALVTPFTDDASAVDFDKLKELIDYQIDNGITGIVPAGCTGEAATLSHEEQQQLIRRAVEIADGRCKVLAGTGSNNTAEALKLTKFAKEVGADGALVITPYYNKPTPEGQYRHYKLLAEEADIPLMLYNVPGRTGTKILPETIARLHKEVENVVAVKEACGSVEQVCSILDLCSIEVSSGDDALTLGMMSVGGVGVVSVIANLLPAEMVAIVNAAAAGDFARAREVHYKIFRLMKAMFIETNPMTVKTAMRLVGRLNGILRMPLCEMTAKGESALREKLQGYGLKLVS